MALIYRNYRFLAVTWILGFALLWFCDVSRASNEAVDLFRQRRVLNAAQAFLDEGRRELDRGVYVRAIRVLSQAINKGADPEAFKLRGQAYDSLEESQKAISDFSSYINARGSDPEGHILRGDAYNAAHGYENALSDFTRAIELDPSSGEAYLGSGIAYLGLEEYELAAKQFRLVMQHDPRNTDALTNLGLAYMLSNRPEEARGFFEKALQIEQDPKWKNRIASWMNDAGSGADSVSPAEAKKRDGLNEEESVPLDTSASAGGSAVATRHARRPVAGPAAGKAALSGSWEGIYMGSKLRMQFQQSGRSINGSVRVQGPGAAENVYNFSGTFEHGKVVASHLSGCSFTGRLTDDRRLVGVLTTPEGGKIPVDLPEHQQ